MDARARAAAGAFLLLAAFLAYDASVKVMSWEALPALIRGDLVFVGDLACVLAAALVSAAWYSRARWHEVLRSPTRALGCRPEVLRRNVGNGALLVVCFCLPHAVLSVWFLDPQAVRDRGLMVAVRSGDAGAVRAQLAAGADPNFAAVVGNGLRPLPAAVYARSVPVAEALLDAGADVEADTPPGWAYAPPLAEAAAVGDLAMMRLLLRHGARVNDMPTGSRALRQAAMTGQTKAMRLLLAHGADPNTTIDEGEDRETLLHAVAEYRQDAYGQEGRRDTPVYRLIRDAGGREFVGAAVTAPPRAGR